MEEEDRNSTKRITVVYNFYQWYTEQAELTYQSKLIKQNMD